jgi:hypothetical protein
VLKMKWHCDVCDMESIRDVPREAHFFAVIRQVSKDHDSTSAACEWMKIHVRLFHPPGQCPTFSGDSDH